METKTGVVVLLDFLGARNFSIEDSIKFIADRDEIVEELHRTELSIKNKDTDVTTTYKLEIATFGDSILIAANTGEQNKGQGLYLISLMLKDIILYCLTKNLLIRGSISSGDYIFDTSTNTVIGPAIADAAYWYEAANWIGIITTPKLHLFLKSTDRNIIALSVPNYIPETIIEYNVPLKNGKKISLYAINWISLIKGNEERSAIILTLQNLTKNGVEDKYINTLQFLEFSEKIN